MDWIIISCVFMGVFGLTIWYYYCWCQKKRREEDRISRDSCEEKQYYGVPKGNMGWPIIGETLDFLAAGYSSKPVSFMEKRRSMYGKVFKTNILGTPIIISTDAEVNKVVLQNHGNIFIPAYPKSITEMLGQHSILRMTGSFHKRVHSLIEGFLRNPNFKAQITKDIETAVKLSLGRWDTMQPVLVQDEAQNITFEVLVKGLMSVGRGEVLDSLKKDFDEFIKGLICLPIKLPGTTHYKCLKAKKRLLKVVRRIVKERKSSIDNRKSNNGRESVTPMDMVDVLIREPFEFVTGNVIEMMIPGEENVPMAMTMTIKYLTDNPLVLDRLREENMEFKRQKMVSSSTKFTWTDYMSLPITQNVISETLRLANIINGIWRKALKDVEIKGYLIPKDWCVLTSFTSVHMREENYQDPYIFDPWRWEGIGATGNSKFTPFGGGQRLCPAVDLSRLQLAIFLHLLVTNYRWVAENDEIVHFPTCRMKNKMPIIVTSILSS